MTDFPYGWRGAGRIQGIDEVRQRVRAAFNLWRGGDYLNSDCHATEYLAARGVRWLAAKRFRDTIRWCPNAWHPSGRQLPALYCAVTDVHGAFRAVQRIYLKPDRPEKFGPPASFGPVAGHAVQFATLDQILSAGDMVIGEGIETTASACTLLRLPGWSAIAAGNLRNSLILPPEVRNVTIAVDRDRPGECAAKAAARRWRAEGRSVRLIVPNRDGDDANDLLRESRPDE